MSDPEKQTAHESDREAVERPVTTVRSNRSTRQSSRDHITLGSRKSDVARIQGPPNSTHVDEDMREEGWSYDKVYVTFNRSGRVTGWSIFSGELSDANVRLVAGANATSSPLFSIDSHKDDIVRLQGTPYRIDTEWDFEFRNERDLNGRHFKTRETWYFSGGTVEFSISTGRVIAFDNKDGSLIVQIPQSDHDAEWKGEDFFTFRSTQRDVKKVQGEPISKSKDALGTEIWHYGRHSEVEFKSGRVLGWNNIGGGLKVRLVPGPNVTHAPLFSIGSHKDDVARLQGTPRSVSAYRSRSGIGDFEIWHFNGGTVNFSSSDHVIDWENRETYLKARGIRPQTMPGETRRPTVSTARTQGCGCMASGAALIAVAAIAAVYIA